jgi:endonuclease III
VRKHWQAFGAFVLRLLGWTRPMRVEFGIKTEFRKAKETFTIAEWQSLAQVFKSCPDLEEFIHLKIEGLNRTLHPIGSEGDRARLVKDAQMEVLHMFAGLPEFASAKVNELLRAKPVQKGMTNV